MVLPEGIVDASGVPTAPPAPPTGAVGTGLIPPPAQPAGSVSAGTVATTETPVAGMSIEGLASILGPMLAEQFTKTKPTGTTDDTFTTAINQQYAKDCMMSSFISLSGMQSETAPLPEYF